MKFELIRNIVWALLIDGVVLGSMPLTAADGPAKQRGGSETTISEKELVAFVKAYVDYQKIRSSYGPALESAKDPQQKQRIEREANTKVKQSLEATGLTAERYNEIFTKVNGNERLRNKVLKKVEDERRKS
jgi:hypothetical protein